MMTENMANMKRDVDVVFWVLAPFLAVFLLVMVGDLIRLTLMGGR